MSILGCPHKLHIIMWLIILYLVTEVVCNYDCLAINLLLLSQIPSVMNNIARSTFYLVKELAL